MSDDNLISLTNEARAHIIQFLTSREEGSGVRLDVKKTGCSGYAYLVDIVSAPQTDDIVIEQEGIKLFIAAKAVGMVKGTVIDYQIKGANQKQLVFNNPNAEDYCGCGESFTLKTDHP